MVLGWFQYLDIAFTIESLFLRLWWIKLCDTMLLEQLLNISVISLSPIIILSFSIKYILSEVLDLSEKNIFTVFQNCLLSTIFFIFKFEKYCFVSFFSDWSKNFFVFLCFLSLKDLLLFRNLLRNFDLITRRSSLLIKGAWFGHICFWVSWVWNYE